MSDPHFPTLKDVWPDDPREFMEAWDNSVFRLSRIEDPAERWKACMSMQFQVSRHFRERWQRMENSVRGNARKAWFSGHLYGLLFGMVGGACAVIGFWLWKGLLP